MNIEKINTLNTKDVAEKFIRYVQIDTQSDPTSETFPSTEKQKDLGKLLVEELLQIGITDAHMDSYGYVYGTLPSNVDHATPVICFCSHMDTSPDSSGKGVKPLVHTNYQGQDIVLPLDEKIIISPAHHPDLNNQLGFDIITASGDTLLGADDKAGIAEIMTAVELLVNHPEIPHGEIKILFTPDEEIGRGVDYVDLKKLGADFAYTLDGETVGSIEDETFSADGGLLILHGISAHPGFAKGKMQSAMKWAADVIQALPQGKLSPETTSGREGFIHPVGLKGGVEKVEIEFIIRDFNSESLVKHAQVIEEIAQNTLAAYPGCRYEWTTHEQYRNMKEILDQHPRIMEIGIEAIIRVGLEPKPRSIRGGTDGSRLSQLGLPCPNVFAGGHAFHSKEEWVSIQDMEKAVLTIMHIANLWVDEKKIK